MKIQICGPGCAKCGKAHDIVERVVNQKGLHATITKVSDFQEIAKLGVFTTPAIVVDGEVKCVGKVPSEKEVVNWLVYEKE